jgi:hypothetical protein
MDDELPQRLRDHFDDVIRKSIADGRTGDPLMVCKLNGMSEMIGVALGTNGTDEHNAAQRRVTSAALSPSRPPRTSRPKGRR